MESTRDVRKKNTEKNVRGKKYKRHGNEEQINKWCKKV